MTFTFRKAVGFAGLAAVAAAAWFLVRSGSGSAGSESRTIRWYVVHARDYKEYNDQLMAFAQRLREKTSGALNVEFTYSGIGSGWRDGDAERNGYEQVAAGQFDMSQLGTDTLDASVLTLPHLFRNYDHAEAVWRGPVGQKLLDGISQRSDGKLEALAFSYSGGFRALVGTRPVRSADDVKGANIQIKPDSLMPDESLLLELGANGLTAAEQDFPKERESVAGAVKQMGEMLRSGKVDLFSVELNGLAYIEMKYGSLNVHPLYVNVTDQSMYSTAMVANAAFLSSLPDDLRRVLVDETRDFALAERRLSAELAERNLETFATKYGHTVVKFPAESQARFIEAGKAVQRTLPQWADMIREIQSAGEIPLLAASAAPAKIAE
jgi:TRAP-type C4-dicarboxylate transport system substrate-binding protein